MAKIELPTTDKARKAAKPSPARGAVPANDCAWLERFKADALAARRDVGTFDVLDRMATLARRLDIGSRQIGEALMEAADCQALADSVSLKDALDISTLLDEQIGELSELVERAFYTVREAKRARGQSQNDTGGSVDPAALYLAAIDAFAAGLIDEEEQIRAWQAMADWQPTSLEGFARKVIAMFVDGGMPERPFVDALMADGARLVQAR